MGISIFWSPLCKNRIPTKNKEHICLRTEVQQASPTHESASQVAFAGACQGNLCFTLGMQNLLIAIKKLQNEKINLPKNKTVCKLNWP